MFLGAPNSPDSEDAGCKTVTADLGEDSMKMLISASLLILVSVTAAWGLDPGWPRQMENQGNTLVIYQPQVDDWKNFTELDFRMAVSLTPAGGRTAVGVLVLKGDTQVENENKMVMISNLRIVSTHFPSLDSSSTELLDRLARTFLPSTVTVSLHQLVACVPKKESVPGVQLRNDPPAIFVSYKPAILLDLDGPPVRAPVQKTKLEYLVNTYWPLFFEPSKSNYYLLAGQQWLTAATPDGPWLATTKLPKEMSKLRDNPQWADLKNSIPPPPAKPGDVVPMVFYSIGPADIILFDGQPSYAQIPGTRLAYATNTSSYVFLHTPTSRYYYLTAGRWFRANGLGGPWTFATPDLPADFARIPPTSPAAQVLASVPGTEEAKDAVLMAQIPTMVVVNPATAAALAKVTYEGSPQFVLIEGTSMSYATNTVQKVIRVGELYYLCFQGVWFVSASPQGPWQTAQSVPAQIYTIPPSSPVYNVTYVTQVTTYNGYVQASYTAGYMGAFVMGVTVGAVVAGGTGYHYPPYVAYPPYGYPVYHPYPATYGAEPYHNPATGAYGVSQTAYGPYGSATKTASYNPYTGTYARTASASTAYGSAKVGQAYNPYTGASGTTKQGSNAYSSWGSSEVTKGSQSAYAQHDTTAKGTTGSVQTSSGGKAAGETSAYGSTSAAKSSSGNMYATHDGNVYKDTGSGWEKDDNGSWNSAKPPTSTSSQPQAQQKAQNSSSTGSQQKAQSEAPKTEPQGMEQEKQNRERGEQSSQRSQEFHKSGGGGGGGRGRR